MKLRWSLKTPVLVAVLIITSFVFSTVTDTPLVQAQTTIPKQKGMGIIAYYSNVYPSMDDSVQKLAETGSEWISIYVTAYQDNINSTAITRTRVETPTDDDLRHIINYAHSLGLKVMLKPQIDLYRDPDHWRGQIGRNFNTEAQWNAWFTSYKQMIGHYAALAESTNVEEFAIGTELIAVTHRASNWRDVVSHVRSRYSGPILYAANHTGEEVNITWWDAVDIIGVVAYYKLTDSNNATVDQLKTAWAPHVQTMANLANTYNKPVIIVELGYRSMDGAIPRPWCYKCSGAVDLEEQRRGYEALYQSVWNKPWLGGLYWFRWDTHPQRSGPCDNDYSPYNKPAENVIRTWYGVNTKTLPTTCGGPPPTPDPGGPTNTPRPPTATPPAPPPPTNTPVPPPTNTPVPPPTNTPGPPTPTPRAGTTLMVYNDNLVAGWADWSWHTNVNMSQSNIVQSGSGAIAASYTQAWGALSLRGLSTANISDAQGLHFWIRGTSDNQVVNVRLVRADNSQTPPVRIVPVANTWTEVIIPRANFGNIGQINGILWQDGKGSAQPTFYLDDIYFVSQGAPPPPPPPNTPVSPTAAPTATPIPPTNTPVPPTATSEPPTNTPLPPTNTPVSPTPTPNVSTSLTVYGDSLGTGWNNWSWGANVNFSQGNVVRSGSAAIAVNYTRPWSGLYLGNLSAVDVRGYNELHFWMRGSAAGQAIDVQLVRGDSTRSARVRIQPPANTWLEVTIPLSRFGTVADVRGLVWQEVTGAPQPAVYLDEIAFRQSASVSAMVNAYVMSDAPAAAEEAVTEAVRNVAGTGDDVSGETQENRLYLPSLSTANE